MKQEVQDHQKTIAVFEGAARNGSSPQLRALAAQMLPELRAHLAMRNNIRIPDALRR